MNQNFDKIKQLCIKQCIVNHILFSLQIQSIDNILDDDSSSQDQLPQFESQPVQKQKHKWVLPSYTNIQSRQLILISIVFLILQYIIYFCLETCITYSDIKQVYYDVARDLMIFITMLVVLCSEKLLSLDATKYIEISTKYANIILFLSLISSNLYYEYQAKDSNAIKVLQYILQFIITILGGFSLGLQILGCFYYMIKSIKKTDQKLQQSQCLILAIFLSLQTLGQNFHDIIPQNSDIIFTQATLYIAIAICLCLYYCLPIIPIHTFDNNELIIKEILDGIYNARDLQIEVQNQQAQIDFDGYDDLNERVSLIENQKNEQFMTKLKKQPKIIQFYYNVLLKQTTGIKILFESLLYAFISCTGTMYYQLYYDQTLYPTCLSFQPYSSFTLTCWMDNYLFKNYFTIQTAIIIVVLIINGFVYDFLNVNTQNDVFCQQFQIIVSSLVDIIAIIIPSLFTITYKPYREAFIYLLFIGEALSLMTIIISRQQYV